MIYPRDTENGWKGRKARLLLPAMLNFHHWEYHEQTGTDHGTDMVLELIEDGEFRDSKIEGQIKGRSNLREGKKGFPLRIEVKTLSYGLMCKNAYVIFLLDLDNEKDAYYLAVQDYFIANPEFYKKLEENSTTFTIYFSPKNRVDAGDSALIGLAKASYLPDAEGHLHKYQL